MASDEPAPPPPLGSIQRLVTDPAQEDGFETDKWTLYYYPLKNRGNFIRLLFAYKDEDFAEIRNMDEVKTIFATWDGLEANMTNDQKENEYYSPPFALPGIKYNDTNSNEKLFLSQMTVIVPFVAEKLGLLPNVVGSIEDYQARKLLCDCNDIINEIYGLASGRYRSWTLEECKIYFDTRFEKWLSVLEYPLLQNKKQNQENKYYFGNKISYIDIAVYNLIDGFYELLKEKIFYKIFDKHKCLLELYTNIGDIEQIKLTIGIQNKEEWRWFSKRSQINEKIYPKLQEAYKL